MKKLSEEEKAKLQAEIEKDRAKRIQRISEQSKEEFPVEMMTGGDIYGLIPSLSRLFGRKSDTSRTPKTNAGAKRNWLILYVLIVSLFFLAIIFYTFWGRNNAEKWFNKGMELRNKGNFAEAKE